MNATEIQDRHYEEIRELVHRKAGIALGGSRQALVQARLAKRLRALKLDDFDATELHRQAAREAGYKIDGPTL